MSTRKTDSRSGFAAVILASIMLGACAGAEGPDDGTSESELRRSDCALEIGLVCPAGQEDECVSNPNGSHRCISASGEGGDCALEIGLVCPAGQEDECVSNPNGSHRCISR